MIYRIQLYSVLLFGALLICHTISAQDIENYVKEHAQTSGKKDFSIEFGESKLLDANLIFFGFIHGGATAQSMDFELLKFAMVKGGAQYYAPEVNVSQAFFLNKYLVSGNIEYLDFALYFYTLKVPQDASVQLREKWIKIHKLNQQLPKSKRIQVIGTDTPFYGDKRLAITHLAYLLADTRTGDPMVDSLKYFTSMDLDVRNIWSGKPALPLVEKYGGHIYDYVYPRDSRYGFSKRFATYYEENKSELRQTLKPYGIDPSEIFDYKGDDREEHIFKNFEKYVIPLIRDGNKVYSNFGYAHVHQHEIYGRDYLACKIKKQYPEVRQHTVLGLLAKSSVLKGRKWKKSDEVISERGLVFERMVSKGHSTSKSWDGHGLFEQLEGVKFLLTASKREEILFMDLTREQSPFADKPYLVAYQRGGKGTQIDPGSNTLDYFQFVLLMIRSEPNVPLTY